MPWKGHWPALKKRQSPREQAEERGQPAEARGSCPVVSNLLQTSFPGSAQDGGPVKRMANAILVQRLEQLELSLPPGHPRTKGNPGPFGSDSRKGLPVGPFF